MRNTSLHFVVDNQAMHSNLAAGDKCLKCNGENIPTLIDRQSQLTLLKLSPSRR